MTPPPLKPLRMKGRPSGISVYEFPRRHLARVLFGNDSIRNVRRIDSMLDGESRMSVDVFWAMIKLEPLMSIEKSLRDLYERYEIAKWRKEKKTNANGKD